MPFKRTFIITAGGTQEPLDPVRYIGNRSSGKMGLAILKACLKKKFDCVLIHGSISVPLPAGRYKKIGVQTAEEMFHAVKKELAAARHGAHGIRTAPVKRAAAKTHGQLHADSTAVLIMAAAVADFRPAAQAKHKIKKDNTGLTLELIQTTDILRSLPADPEGRRFVAGFAAETRDLLKNSLKKLREKRMNMVIANDVSRKDIGFGSDSNKVTVLYSSGGSETLPRMGKDRLGEVLLEKILSSLHSS
jgi:phosphopantothenoylcysteine decarboxylase / phosphopantothenate---cysteine ligase